MIMNIDMRPIGRLAAGIVIIGISCIVFVGGMGTMAFISGPCECTEITSTAGKIQPNLTIKCFDLELTKCDTTYTYKARW